MHPLFGPVGQIGYVVDDLEAAARHWFETTGVGPWYVIPHVPLDHFTHDTQASPVEIGIASAYSGGVEIELIQQHNDAPSMYREMLDTAGPGVQHVCFYPPDYDAAMDAATATGMTVGQEGAIHGIRFAYLRGPSGLVLELADLPPAVVERRARSIAAAAAWDGTDPIRIRA